MYSGIITKLHVKYDNPIQYSFLIEDNLISFNSLLNQNIRFHWTGKVQCICNKILSKFYRQNFCYKCYWNAPEASQSIFKPELCQADLGIEERDLEWEKKFQLSPHFVYLANSSGLKVGVTRKNQHMTRWMDQGASQAIVLAEVPNRRVAGLIEVELKQVLADKTNYRKMLMGKPVELNLLKEKEKCISFLPLEYKSFLQKGDVVTNINYPVLEYPKKVNSMSLEKNNSIGGRLKGIKGQYLIFENNMVFNVRAHTRFLVNFQINS